MNDEPGNTLDRHMALVALIISKLAETGLSARDIDSERSKAFLGVAADPTELGSVLTWMVDEEIVRSKRLERHSTGAVFLKEAQLTAKGLATIQPLTANPSKEKQSDQVQTTAGHVKWPAIISNFLHRPNGSTK
jgi:hypothetical protein